MLYYQHIGIANILNQSEYFDVQVPASLSIHSHSFNLEAFTMLQYTGLFYVALLRVLRNLSAGNSGLQI